MAEASRTIRQLALATVFTVSLGGVAWAQGTQQPANSGNDVPGTQARQVDPSPMPQGSRAAEGTGAANNVPGIGAQQVNPSPMVPGSRAGPRRRPAARQRPDKAPARRRRLTAA